MLGLLTTDARAAEAPTTASAEDATHDFPFLPDEPSDVSVSVGDTSNGYLVQGAPIVETEALGILPRQRERELRYGTGELVMLLEEASRALFDATKTRLWLGNVGRRGGGDIPYSVSHNSGRDADVAFSYLDLKGRPVDPADLIRIGPSGATTSGGMRFDAARTWRVVKSLISSKHATVQWLFISAPLERQLILHARRQGEPAALLAKATDAMLQPGGSGAHDDHLHVRVFCSERDVLGGCQDAGTEQRWHHGFEREKRERSALVATFLRAPEAEVRKRALDRLVLLDAPAQLDGVLRALDDPEAVVRHAAVRAVAAMGGESHVDRLAQLFATDADTTVRIAVIQAAARLGGRASGVLLASAVGTSERDAPLLVGLSIALGAPVEQALALDAWSFVRAWRAARAGTELLAAEALERSVGPPLPIGQAIGTAAVAPLPSVQALGTSAEPLGASASWGLATALAEYLVAPLFAEARMHETMQLVAIDAAGLSERFEPVGPLIRLLDDRRLDVRTAADRALRMLTNTSYPTHFDGELATRAKSHAMWSAAWQRSQRVPRDVWLVNGFRSAGYDVRELSTHRAWDLVRATAGPPHISFNAQRTLMRLFRHYPDSLAWSEHDACRHWLRWVASHRHQHRIAAPPATVWKACTAPREVHD